MQGKNLTESQLGNSYEIKDTDEAKSILGIHIYMSKCSTCEYSNNSWATNEAETFVM